jgi:hypothetical protein
MSEKQILFEEQRKQINAHCEANEKIAILTMKIQQCEDQSVLADTDINSLHHMITALKNIEESARLFWRKIYIHYKQFSTEKIRQKISNSLEKYDERKRHNLYHSYPFKREVIDMYVKWIAMVS